MSLAWHTATFSALTRGRRSKLKALAHYLRRSTPEPLTVEETETVMAAVAAWQQQIDEGR